jgi:dipeptidyl aminopeptidase/acylaminoacyl peptidase
VKEQVVSFQSAAMRLHGVIGVPEASQAPERRAAFLVLHGFGSNSDSSNVLQPTRMLNEFGYVTLRFDMRGCRESDGEFGRVICLEQVEDLNNALAFLATHPAVDPDRIGAIGSSFGGAVAVYAAGTNPAVISNGGWGHGERKFRGQHRTLEAWAKFTNMLKEGRAYRARTGKSLMVPRYDIVPIPDHVTRAAKGENARAELRRGVSGGDGAKHVRLPHRGCRRANRAAPAAVGPPAPTIP